MSSQDLDALLAELHVAAEASAVARSRSRASCSPTVARDIEQALATDDASAVAPEPVEALAVRFEADHPSLAGVLRQIMDTLGKAGI